MSSDPQNVDDIPVGTPVIGFDGSLLGHVREVHPHYLLVHQQGQHGDHQIPVGSIQGFVGDQLQVSVGERSVTDVDDEETTHRMDEDRG